MYQHISKTMNNDKRNNTVLNNIPELAQKPLTEIVEVINSQFATICQTYPPLNKSSMKNILKNLLSQWIFHDKLSKNLQYSLHYHLLTLQLYNKVWSISR